MPVERFYTQSSLNPHEKPTLEGAEHHHICVLRMRIGDTLELVNGRGALATGKILFLSKNAAQIEILSSIHEAPPRLSIHAAIPLMRPSKLEWVIEKGTELGADAFFLYTADLSEKDSLSSHQIERFHTICVSAMKQSGRLYLPSIEILPRLEDLLKTESKILFGDSARSSPYPTALREPTLFITGPEKGFSSREKELLASRKAEGSKLSENILRAETAPIAALTFLSAFR